MLKVVSSSRTITINCLSGQMRTSHQTTIHLLVGGAAGHVHSVDPWLQYICIRPAVRVGRQAEPLARQVARDIEWATLLIALDEALAFTARHRAVGEIDPIATTPRTQIGMDLVDGRAVQPGAPVWPDRRCGRTDQRHADDCATVARDCAATF